MIRGDLNSNLSVVLAFRCWPEDAKEKGETPDTAGGMNKSRTTPSCKKSKEESSR